jgi:preprotein translocase subunit YajC
MEVTGDLWFLLAAQAGGGAQEGGNAVMTQFLFLGLIFFIFYFLLIRPVRQRQKSHEALLSELKNGDKVVTQGGLRGTIAGITDDVVHLRVADNVKIELNKSAVAGRQSESSPTS